MTPQRHRFSILLTTLVGLWAVLPAAEARRARRHRPRAATKPPADEFKGLGHPKIVVAYRAHIAAFARTATVLKERSLFPTVIQPLDPGDPVADLREDIEEHKPRIVVALGALAARVSARGFGDAAVVFAYGTLLPKTAVRRGGWLRHGADPAVVLRWLTRLRPGIKSVGVLLHKPRDPLAREVRRVARRYGIRVFLASESVTGGPLRALLSLVRQRPQAIWLGHGVEAWTPARLRAALRLQSIFRIPLVGITPEHVRRGFAAAVDGDPASVAGTLDTFIRARVRRWLVPAKTVVAPAPDRRRRRRRRRLRKRRPRRTRLATSVEAMQLAVRRVPAKRVTVNGRTLRALGLNPKLAVAAGALEVRR